MGAGPVPEDLSLTVLAPTTYAADENHKALPCHKIHKCSDMPLPLSEGRVSRSECVTLMRGDPSCAHLKAFLSSQCYFELQGKLFLQTPSTG